MSVTKNLFIGRESEVTKLISHARNTFLNNHGKIIFLEGEAGIGKTTLGKKCCSLIQGEHTEVQYLYTYCSDKTSELYPYAPFVHLHKNLFEEILNNSSNKIKESWLPEYVKEVGPDFLDLIPLVGPALKIAVRTFTFTFQKKRKRIDSQPIQENKNQDGQISTFQKFVDSLRFLALKKPLLLFVDDWHWADESSTNLLFYLSRQLDQLPILFIATYRPHEARARKHSILAVRDEMVSHHLCEEVELTSLTKEEIKEYLYERFPNSQFSLLFVNWLQKITNGNSLFLREYLELMIAEKKLSDSGKLMKGWKVLNLPSSVKGVVNSRIRYLSAHEQKVLSYCSVEGEKFSTLLIEKILKTDRLDLLKTLRQIQNTHDLVCEIDHPQVYNEPSAFYQFNHAIIYEAFYDRLSIGGKKEICHRLLDIKNRYYDKVNENVRSQMLPQLIVLTELTSNHFLSAKFSLEAANDASKSYAHSEVIKHCNVGLMALGKSQKSNESQKFQIELLFLRGYTEWWFRGNWELAIKDYSEIESIANERKDSDLLSRVYNRIGGVYELQHERTKAIDFYKKASNIKVTEQSLVGVNYSRLAWVFRSEEDYDQALVWAKKALKINEELNDDKNIVSSYLLIGMILGASNKYKEGLAWCEKAIRKANALNDESLLSSAYNQTALMQIVSNSDLETALTHLKKAVEITRKKNDVLLLAVHYHNIASTYKKLKKFDKAIEWYQKVVDIREKASDLRNLAITWQTMGSIAIEKKDFKSAMNYYTLSRGVFEKIDIFTDGVDSVDKKLKEVKSKLSKKTSKK